MLSMAWATAGFPDAFSVLNAVVYCGSAFIWSILTRRLMIAHSSFTVMLSFSFSNTFLYLKGMPWMNCSFIRLVLSSVRCMWAAGSSTIARLARRCRSVRKSSSCSFTGSNFLDCRSSSKFLLWSAPAYRLRSCSSESSRSFLVFSASRR